MGIRTWDSFLTLRGTWAPLVFLKHLLSLRPYKSVIPESKIEFSLEKFDLNLALGTRACKKITNKRVKAMHALRVTSEAGNTATQTSDHADHSNN